MPYLTRPTQLWNTLLTFEHWYGHRNDYEVIIVVDGKNTKIDELDLVETRNNFNVDVKIVEPKVGNWNSPGPHYNQGVDCASGEYVILTSPEVMHTMDVLAALDTQELESYIVCACENVVNVPKAIDYSELTWKHKQWYQHTVHRPSNYHFCSCIKRGTYLKLGGFDEAFGPGIAFDDNDWRDTVICGGISLVANDSILTAHQDHKHFILGPERRAIWELNRALYAKKCEERGIAWNEN
jgi:hypothetical protein